MRQRRRISTTPAIQPACLVTGQRLNQSGGNTPITFRSESGYTAQCQPDDKGRFEVELVPSVKAGYYEAEIGEGARRGTRRTVKLWVPNIASAMFDSIISRKG